MFLHAQTIVNAYNLFCQYALLNDMLIPFHDMNISVTFLPSLAVNLDNKYKFLHQFFAPSLAKITINEEYEDQNAMDTQLHKQIEDGWLILEALFDHQGMKLDFKNELHRKRVYNQAVYDAINLHPMLLQEQPHAFQLLQQLHMSWLVYGLNSNNFKFRPSQPKLLVPKKLHLIKQSTHMC